MVQRKFDRIHEMNLQWGATLNKTTATNSTIVPLIMNDDALGDPMSFNANPEHASWSEIADPNCYPDSEIRNLKIILELQATKEAWNLQGFLQHMKVSYALIACAFPEDLDAIDEKSGLSLKAILELQKETTDRQCYPLFNAIDLLGVPNVLPPNVPGLT